MQAVKTISTEYIWLFLNKMSDYVQLIKLRLSLLVVFSAGVAYLLGTMGAFNWFGFWILSLGGLLVTGSSNAINQMLEKDYDSMMSRTANRPLATARMSPVEAALFAGITGLTGLILLSWYFNPLTGLISAISLLLYSFVYTPLKRVSPIAVFVGAVPGALPVAIGWLAATGTPSPYMWILFSIQFLWQFPHFWAIAWVSHEDYQKAGFKLLPSTGGRDRVTALQCVLYIAFLVSVSILPALLGIIGIYSIVALIGIGIMFLIPAMKLVWDCSRRAALGVMFGSFLYLPVALVILLVNQL